MTIPLDTFVSYELINQLTEYIQNGSSAVKNPKSNAKKNQRNGVEELTFVTFGFDWHNALI